MRLYREAFAHKSMHPILGYSQERLEFLGDAVLHMAVTALLFKRFSILDEGVLSRLRTSLENGATLARIGRSMHLEKYIRVAPLHAARVLACDAVYEDTLEALIGAVHCDSGMEAAVRFVRCFLEQHVDYETLVTDIDKKSVLKRRLGGRNRPVYATIKDTDGTYVCHLHAMGLVTQMHGDSRKGVEREAAAKCLTRIGYTKHDARIVKNDRAAFVTRA